MYKTVHQAASSPLIFSHSVVLRMVVKLLHCRGPMAKNMALLPAGMHPTGFCGHYFPSACVMDRLDTLVLLSGMSCLRGVLDWFALSIKLKEKNMAKLARVSQLCQQCLQYYCDPVRARMG
jgi:hypothetical protein